MILFLQIVSILVLFIEYIPQIIKIIKTKHVDDFSLTYWFMKMFYTVIAIIVLILSGNTFVVMVAQLSSLFLAAFVTILIFVYKEHK